MYQLKSSDYSTDEEFLKDLMRAKAGCTPSQHTMWSKLCSKQVKYETENWAVAYDSFLKSIEKADITKLTTDPKKKSYYVFAKLFKIMFFKYKRLEFIEQSYPIKESNLSRTLY